MPVFVVALCAQLSTRSKLLRRSHFREQAGYKPVLQLGGPAVMGSQRRCHCRTCGSAVPEGLFSVFAKGWKGSRLLKPQEGIWSDQLLLVANFGWYVWLLKSLPPKNNNNILKMIVARLDLIP